MLAVLCLCASSAGSLHAQTIDDGIMMGRNELFIGNLYTHDSWDEYWEGTLKRDNGNIGTITTRTSTLFANYGVTDRLNIIATVPYVWTEASQGVLRGMDGFQDVTFAAKYSVIDRPLLGNGALRVIAGVSGGVPLTNYTPDFQPLSIGLGSKRIAGRFTMNFQTEPGWFVNGSTAYGWRSTVTLDRPFYFTDGRLFLTDEVEMPNVFDYVVSTGYMKRGLMTSVSFSQQRTQGGGDIRRQDMPFVSNRMNFSRVSGMVMTPLPKLRNLNVHFAYGYTVDGRNVGQSSTFTVGLLYKFRFHGGESR
jgi:hypothetical protein